MAIAFNLVHWHCVFIAENVKLQAGTAFTVTGLSWALKVQGLGLGRFFWGGGGGGLGVRVEGFGVTRQAQAFLVGTHEGIVANYLALQSHDTKRHWTLNPTPYIQHSLGSSPLYEQCKIGMTVPPY